MNLLIFDVGGVLRDSKHAMYIAFKKAFERAGIEFRYSPSEVWHLRGIGSCNSSKNAVKVMLCLSKENIKLKEILCMEDAEEILEEICKRHKLSEDVVNRISTTYKEIFGSQDIKKYIKVFPYAEKAINRLKEKGYELAIFTNASKKTVIRDIPFYRKFSVILGEEEVKKKPSGEGILKICEILGYKSKEAGYVGDSQVDILAARDAGCLAIAVLSGMGLRIHLEKLKPDYLFKNIFEMSEKL